MLYITINIHSIHTCIGLFDCNSRTVTCHVLRDSIFAVCGNSTQLMITLIPMYAGVIAALHNTLGIDIGAFIIEYTVVALHKVSNHICIYIFVHLLVIFMLFI